LRVKIRIKLVIGRRKEGDNGRKTEDRPRFVGKQKVYSHFLSGLCCRMELGIAV
jgi:hypothetical protein